VQDFLKGLFAELENRCESISARASAQGIHPNAANQALRTYRTVVRCQREAQLHRTSVEINDPANTPLFIRRYRALSQEVQLAERFGLVFVERHEARDQRLTALIRRFIEDARLGITPPLAGGFSSQYYWTNKDYSVISFPATEEAALLGLPDMVHEIGHLVSHIHLGTLLGTWQQSLLVHFEGLITGATGPDEARKWQTVYGWWSDRWAEEMVCDVLATYLVGHCYGWQNLRLSLNDPDPYASSSTHPSNDARVTVVEATLNRLVATAAAADQRRRWNDYLVLIEARAPIDYSDCYPNALLDELVDSVLAGASAIGFRPHSQYSLDEFSLPRCLCDAWGRQLDDPTSYNAWQSNELDRLWSVVVPEGNRAQGTGQWLRRAAARLSRFGRATR
jgi:hypothetical protein